MKPNIVKQDIEKLDLPSVTIFRYFYVVVLLNSLFHLLKSIKPNVITSLGVLDNMSSLLKAIERH